MNEFYKHLVSLPKEILEIYILELMKDEKVSFADIANLHVKYIEELKKGNEKELMQLRGKVIGLWCGTKKEVPSKLVAMMQEAKDNGWANISQEQIDNSKWNRK